MTWNRRKFRIDSIAQISTSTSAWRGDILALVFLAPIRPSKPSKVLYHLYPEKKISSSFYDPSVKHHIPGMIGRLVVSTSIFWKTLCANETCASVHNIDFVSANFKVSLGSTSILLRTLLFLHIQIYHNIQANWWSSICGITLQNKLSIFAKSDGLGKTTGFDEMFEMPKLVSPVDIQKTHDLLILPVLHTLHIKYLLASPLLASFS